MVDALARCADFAAGREHAGKFRALDGEVDQRLLHERVVRLSELRPALAQAPPEQGLMDGVTGR